ncbi:MAG: arylsulfatase [Deltaproteobacteria bacterium]|nr:arylsulfatase [Deltaproteobacteria bacterium]
MRRAAAWSILSLMVGVILLDRNLADRAVNWIRAQKAAAPETPFFVYYAPGTAYSSHHAPKE